MFRKAFFLFCFFASFFKKTNVFSQKIFQGGANQTHLYFHLLKNKKIGVVSHQCSVVHTQKKEVHLIDFLIKNGFFIAKIFSPEHGFRGKEDAAKHIKNQKDKITGINIISLYGKNKKLKANHLENIDLMLFDLQDVGVRFYTYLSTLHYVMEACAESKIPLIVLDRPNPNGHYIDGPILKKKYKSFVGLHPVPVVYGMTIGEYAKMINGEKWLKNKMQCPLTIIPLENYTHKSRVHLPIKPSPNLPNDKAINLYPSLGFFEGTTINSGRGTDFPFQCYGHPFYKKKNFSYLPIPKPGATHPKHKNKKCYGVDLKTQKRISKINIKWLYDAYHNTPKNQKFFGKTFTIHAGNKLLEQQLKKGLEPKQIQNSWKKDLKKFKKIQKKYLIYP